MCVLCGVLCSVRLLWAWHSGGGAARGGRVRRRPPPRARPPRGTSALCAPEHSAGPANELTTSNDSNGEMGTRVTLAHNSLASPHARAICARVCRPPATVTTARVCRHFNGMISRIHIHMKEKIKMMYVCVTERRGEPSSSSSSHIEREGVSNRRPSVVVPRIFRSRQI